VLAHAPGLVQHGSKPSREVLTAPELLEPQLRAALRPYDMVAGYAPNQVFIGNLPPEALWDHPQPWWQHTIRDAQARGPHGEILPETELIGLLRLVDDFDLIHLHSDFAAHAADRLRAHAHWSDAPLDKLAKGESAESIAARLESGGTLPLMTGEGALVGYVAGGYPDDASQTPDVLLENLACKASGTLALKHLLANTGLAAQELDYVIGCGEEAVGDRYQRGGGSMAKAIAEAAGCENSTGADVKAFCSGPIHALVMAGALVQAGIYRHVAVVGGGSLAKLGMKFRSHLTQEMPVLEDCLAAVAVLVGPPDAENPQLRLDVVGRHPVRAGGSAQQIYESLVIEPLARIDCEIPAIDRYAVELHNPEITEPGGGGNVPRLNYRTIAGLAALRGQLPRDAIAGFERSHGLPGYCPTQGHIPAGWPYLAHARDRMRAGAERQTLFIAKGSLFLGRMTNLSDGMSILVAAPPSK
jgi:glycine/sarcosine/betaine reductase complex component C subunit beta